MNVFMSVRKNQHGFTLIELMITVVIIAILAAVALPSYNRYVVRSKRSAAQAEMMNIANIEQQYFIANRSYGTKTTIESNGYALPSNLTSVYSYDIAIGTGAVPSFAITFTATGSQASDGNLTLDNAGNKTPSNKW